MQHTRKWCYKYYDGIREYRDINLCQNDWSDQIEKLGNPLIQIIFYFLESVFYHAVKVYVLTFVGD